MLEIHKNYVLDENQQPVAVQIPISEFEQIEEILGDLGLAKLMEEALDDERLSKDEAVKYYQSRAMMWQVEYTKRFLKNLLLC